MAKHLADQEEDPFADSFSFLKPQDSENATVGEQAMWEVFGRRAAPKPQVLETGQKQAAEFEQKANSLINKKPPQAGLLTAQNIRAMDNFTVKQRKKVDTDQDDSSSDINLEEVVQAGINNCVAYVKEAATNAQVPYAISFLLSLTPEQLKLLDQNSQNSAADEPLYINDDLKEDLDHI